MRAGGDYAIAPAGTNRMLVAHAPIGISLLITPWNFPAAMATRKLGPALAAGCTVVLKPAEETPLTALAIVALLERGRRPGGRRQRRQHRRSGADRRGRAQRPARAQALLHRARPRSGAGCSSCARRSVITTSMELGGNAPFLVLARRRHRPRRRRRDGAKMRNGGEACTAANRFLVHESVAEAFTARLTAAMAAVRVGARLRRRARSSGPLINAAAREKVERLVADARRPRRARPHRRRARCPGPGSSTRRRCSTASRTAARSSPRRSSARSRRS